MASHLLSSRLSLSLSLSLALSLFSTLTVVGAGLAPALCPASDGQLHIVDEVSCLQSHVNLHSRSPVEIAAATDKVLQKSSGVSVPGSSIAAEQAIQSQPLVAQTQGLHPAARTFLSADPAASAAWMVKYHQAKYLPLPDHGVVQREAVELVVDVEGPPVTLIFIKDPAAFSAEDGWNATATISEAAASILGTFGPGQPLYHPWVDNHDGYHNTGPFNGSVLNVAAALEDGLPMMVYPEDDGFNPHYIIRVYVPGTLWTIEEGTKATWLSTEQQQQLDSKYAQADPDLCRVYGPTGLEDQGVEGLPDGWWKATYMSADPLAAAEFAVDILGGVPLISQFPWPPSVGCTAAQWVIFPDFSFHMHFVLNKPYETADFTTERAVQEMSGFEALKSGMFHASMYNSLVLTVGSLDEYVLRLRARSLPFMVMQFDSVYALVCVIPKNSITLQLRSPHLSVDVPISESMRALDLW